MAFRDQTPPALIRQEPNEVPQETEHERQDLDVFIAGRQDDSRIRSRNRGHGGSEPRDCGIRSQDRGAAFRRCDRGTHRQNHARSERSLDGSPHRGRLRHRARSGRDCSSRRLACARKRVKGGAALLCIRPMGRTWLQQSYRQWFWVCWLESPLCSGGGSWVPNFAAGTWAALAWSTGKRTAATPTASMYSASKVCRYLATATTARRPSHLR